jgi:hypothetical protein
MRAERQLQRPVILDDLAPLGHRAEDGFGLKPLGARQSRLARVGGGEQGQRRFAEPAYLPEPLETGRTSTPWSRASRTSWAGW